jgi:aldehyde:ferredoxin oxidoreductase
MSYGTSAKVLRVNLTTGALTIETLPDELYRLYPGGKALAGYILLRDLPPHTDALSPENVLVMAAGAITGAPVTTCTRFVMSARSPLTNGYGESEAAGFWGPELKMAGFEAVVVTGRAPEPVYLWIHDGQADVRPANHLWGRHPDEVEGALRTELGDTKVRVLQIGLGGENLVRYAAVTNDLRHFNGRTGMGAVMGSKHLKAVAVRGHQRYASFAYDAEALLALGRKLAAEVPASPQASDLQKRGTLGLVESLNAGGILPTRNFRQGAFEHADDLKWEAYEKHIFTARHSCYACAIRCKREVTVDGRPSPYGGPEYETVGAFGPNLGISDIQLVARANELCDRYTLDTISAGATIAFAMECFEHGLIGLKDTDGLELRFGNGAVLIPLIEKIASRQGVGRLLAEGSRRAAAEIGGDALRFAIQVKGQELAMHDPRGKFNVGLGYAVSEIGSDHLVTPHDPSLANPEAITFKNARPLGITRAEPVRSLSQEKVRQFFILERWVSFGKTVGFCFFGPAPRSFIHPDDVLAVVRAGAGLELTVDDALQIGERATNLARLFNAREGFTRHDDTLPERLFEPLENGALAGQAYPREDFQRALTTLYALKGWDPDTGLPLRPRLEALGLDWAAGALDVARAA